MGSNLILKLTVQFSHLNNNLKHYSYIGGAIDAIVNQIKGGKFQLKSTSENFLEKKQKEEQPEAVKEMLTILGTLRKRRSGNRPYYATGCSVDKSGNNG